MLAGKVSTTLTLVAVLGPLLVTTWVYVIVAFASTGTGLGVFVIDRSAVPATIVFTAALLLAPLGSVVVEVTESVWVMVVPDATVAPTVTTKVKEAVVLAGIVAEAVHFKVPKTHELDAGVIPKSRAFTSRDEGSPAQLMNARGDSSLRLKNGSARNDAK